jgi:CBS domain containing-hemolysin-like protein
LLYLGRAGFPRSYVDDAANPLTAGAIAWRVFAVFLLVAANAFFVASEFALVSARRSKVEALAKGGDARARAVQRVLQNLYRYISATQLGITLASLALGWVGEATLAMLLQRALVGLGVDAPAGVAHAAATVTTAFIIITVLHIVLGELTPKALALSDPERVSRVVVYPLRAFATLASPFTVLLNGAANSVLRLLGVQAGSDRSSVHSPEELELIVRHALEEGTFSETDREVLQGVFVFQKKKARDVMRPRTKVVALAIGASENEVWDTLRREGYSRYPVYDQSPDDVVGVFLAKDLWMNPRGAPFVLRAHVREALFVPEGRPAELVLNELRKTRAHMAVVLDEHGGMQGVLTLEDLVEELIGDIADEYDASERTSSTRDGVLELAGSLSLIDVRQDHRLEIPDGSWTTLGGYVFTRLGRVPKIGDRVTFPGGELEVVAMDRKRVAAVRVVRAPAAPAVASPTGRARAARGERRR